MKTRDIAVIAVVIVIIAALGVYWAILPPPAPPVKIRMGVAYITPIEEPWNSALHTALERAIDELGIEYTYEESVAVADVERVLRDYVVEGYDLVWAHSYGFGDAARSVGEAFPDAKILHGSGLEVTANVGIYDYWIHEACYLEGMIAGMMTETNRIGIVGGYPVPDVNILLNAFIQGIHDVNPDAKVAITFIESWYDPPKAAEATEAQIEVNNIDFIFAERYGCFEKATEHGIYAFGNIVDQNELAPDTVITSAVWDLYPFVEDMVTAVREGTWRADNYVYAMAEGCSRLAPYHGLADVVPAEVKAAVESAEDRILTGELVVMKAPGDPREVWPGVVI